MDVDNLINWLLENLFFLFICFFFLIKAIISIKKGFAKELCGLIAIILSSVAILLIAFAGDKYFSGEVFKLVIAMVLLAVLGILYKVIDLFLVSLKLISKLPIVRLLDKILGLVIALLETAVVAWAVYCIVLIMEPEGIKDLVMYPASTNPVCSFLYNHNYLYPLAEALNNILPEIDFKGLFEKIKDVFSN